MVNIYVSRGTFSHYSAPRRGDGAKGYAAEQGERRESVGDKDRGENAKDGKTGSKKAVQTVRTEAKGGENHKKMAKATKKAEGWQKRW